jgi:hypothetical protein
LGIKQVWRRQYGVFFFDALLLECFLKCLLFGKSLFCKASLMSCFDFSHVQLTFSLLTSLTPLLFKPFQALFLCNLGE